MVAQPQADANTRLVRTPLQELVQTIHAEVMRALEAAEYGDAELLTMDMRYRMVYDADMERWYVYGAGSVPHTWVMMRRPPIDLVMRTLSALYLAAAANAAYDGDLNSSRLLRERGRLVQTAKRAEAILRTAAGLSMLGRQGIQWDANPMLLSVQNGVIELDSGTFRKGDPLDMLTYAAPTEWVGLDAAADRWEAFLLSAMADDAERVGFLRRLFGYAVNGTTREHILVLMIGLRGRNGKSVMLKTLHTVLGDYAVDVPRDIVIQRPDGAGGGGNASPHLMELRGRRIAFSNESDEGSALSSAQVKYATGGDAIKARPLYRDYVGFRPTHTLFLATNEPPVARSHDDALHERLVILNFTRRFVDRPMTADERPVDKGLDAALAAESSGILAWLVRGHLEYLREGLRVPESMLLARHQFRNRQSLDGWLHDRAYIDGSAQTRATVLFEDYVTWCGRQGMVPQSQTWFGRQLRELAMNGVERIKGLGGTIVYHGIGLRDDDPPAAAVALPVPAVPPRGPRGSTGAAMPVPGPTVPPVAAVAQHAQVILDAGYDHAALSAAAATVQASGDHWEELDSSGDHGRMSAILRGALCSIERRRIDGVGWRWSVRQGDMVLSSQPTPKAALEQAMSALLVEG